MSFWAAVTFSFLVKSPEFSSMDVVLGPKLVHSQDSDGHTQTVLFSSCPHNMDKFLYNQKVRKIFLNNTKSRGNKDIISVFMKTRLYTYLDELDYKNFKAHMVQNSH